AASEELPGRSRIASRGTRRPGFLVFDAQLLGLGVVLVELGVAAPVHRGLELLLGLLLAEAPAQDVPEEPRRQASVGASLQARPDDPYQGHAVDGGAGEHALRLLDVGAGEPDALDGQPDAAALDP